MLSTDTTWEVVQSFLNVPGMKGVALIDGRSRPYFQGIERVLNSQQREALAQGVWQVLETIPDDFESFEFQFAGTQVYIHKLSQEQILLVLTQDNLIYPDYFDAFSRLREAFTQDSSATMDTFQRLLGARNTKVTPLNLSDVANGEEAQTSSPEDSSGTEAQALDSSEIPSDELQSEEPPTLEIPTLEIPSGAADYTVAADTEITDISAAATEADAPAIPAPPPSTSRAMPTVPLDAEDALNDDLEREGDGIKLPDFAEANDLAATDAGLPDFGEVEASLPDLGSAPVTESQATSEDAAALFAASLANANDLVGRSAKSEDRDKAELPSFEAELPASADEDSLLAVTQPAKDQNSSSTSSPPDSQPPSPPLSDEPKPLETIDRTRGDSAADLATLVDTLSLGDEDFEGQSGIHSIASQATDASSAASENVALPEIELQGQEASKQGNENPGNGTAGEQSAKSAARGLPEFEAETSADWSPWDEPDAAPPNRSPQDMPDIPPTAKASTSAPSLLDVTPPGESADVEAEIPDSLLNNRLDAVALDNEVEIDDLFGYEEPPVEPEVSTTSDVALEAYVESLNALGEFSAHYLGRAVIVNYWRTSRPADTWLQGAFAIERSANSIRLGPDYAASRRSPITDGQQTALQTWAGQFVSRCSKVIRDFPHLAQQSLSEDQSKMLDL